MKNIKIIVCLMICTGILCCTAHSDLTLGRLSKPKWDKAEHYYNLGQELMEKEKEEEAKEKFTIAVEEYLSLIKVKPDFPYSYYRLSYIYRNVYNDHEKALDIMTQALKKVKTSFAYLEIGSIFQSVAQTKEGDDAKAAFHNAIDYYTKGLEIKDDGAEENHKSMTFNAFMCYYAVQDWNNTIKYGMMALEYYSGDEAKSISQGIAEAYMQLGKFDEAIASVKKLLKDEPDNPTYNELLLYLYQKAGMDKEFNEQLSKVGEETENPSVLLVAAQKLAEQKKYSEAKKKLIKVIQSEEQTQADTELLVRAYVLLGTICLKEGKTQSAKDNFRLADAYSGSNADVKHTLAYLHFQLGNYHEAAKYYKQVIDLRGATGGLYLDLGNCYYNVGDFANAKEYYLKALKLNSKLIRAHVALVDIYIDEKQYSSAYEHINMALALEPGADLKAALIKRKQAIEDENLHLGVHFLEGHGAFKAVRAADLAAVGSLGRARSDALDKDRGLRLLDPVVPLNEGRVQVQVGHDP